MDESVARSVAEVARLEDRTPSQVVNAAARFYMRLPDIARDSLRRIEATGTDAERAEAMRLVARSLAGSSFEIASRRMAEAIRANNPELMERLKGATEEEIGAEAVRLCHEAGWRSV
jgi:hypothetical protein